MIPPNEAGWTGFILMLEDKHEAALDLYIEQTKAGNPPLGYTGLRPNDWVLKSLPEYTALERLIQEFRQEQRELYDELTAARASSRDTAHP